MCQSGWQVVMESVDSNSTHRYWVVSLGDWMPYWAQDGKKQFLLQEVRNKITIKIHMRINGCHFYLQMIAECFTFSGEFQIHSGETEEKRR